MARGKRFTRDLTGSLFIAGVLRYDRKSGITAVPEKARQFLESVA